MECESAKKKKKNHKDTSRNKCLKPCEYTLTAKAWKIPIRYRDSVIFYGTYSSTNNLIYQNNALWKSGTFYLKEPVYFLDGLSAALLSLFSPCIALIASPPFYLAAIFKFSLLNKFSQTGKPEFFEVISSTTVFNFTLSLMNVVRDWGRASPIMKVFVFFVWEKNSKKIRSCCFDS